MFVYPMAPTRAMSRLKDHMPSGSSRGAAMRVDVDNGSGYVSPDAPQRTAVDPVLGQRVGGHVRSLVNRIPRLARPSFREKIDPMPAEPAEIPTADCFIREGRCRCRAEWSRIATGGAPRRAGVYGIDGAGKIAVRDHPTRELAVAGISLSTRSRPFRLTTAGSACHALQSGAPPRIVALAAIKR